MSFMLEFDDLRPRPSQRAVNAGLTLIGVEGLVSRLELELAVPPPPPWVQRVMDLAAAEWSRSEDPVGAAAESLRLADALKLEGATTAVLPPRWRANLARAMHIEGALADRIAHLRTLPVASLKRRSLRVCVNPDDLPAMARNLVAGLERHGWDVHTEPLPGPSAATVVHRLRGASPTDVAEAVIDRLAKHPQAIVVAADACLEEALAARGGPTLGVRRDGGSHLGVAHRVLSLGFSSQHPQDLLDLLTAAAIPLPRLVVQRLVGALTEFPSWRSEEWRRAVSEIQGASAEVDAALAWIHATVSAVVDETCSVSVESLRARYAELLTLCETLTASAATPLATVCEVIHALLAWVPERSIDRSRAEGVVRLAESAVQGEAMFPAQTGILAEPTLDAVVGPVAALVVWNAAAMPHDSFRAILSSERRALRAAGVKLPDRAARVAAWTRDLQRAIAATHGPVWLCLPDTNAHGEPVDEPPWRNPIDAWLGAPTADTDRTTLRVLASPAPSARETWRVEPSLLRARAKESPSSASTLLGCSLRHALHHQGRVPETFAPALPTGPLLYGRIAHAAFEATWRGMKEVPDPSEVAARAREEAARCIEAQAQTLTLPSARGRRLHLQNSVARAAESLARALQAAHTHVAGVEVPLGRGLSLAGMRWGGRADLVLGSPAAVLDLKWSGTSHRNALAQGTALQLALYAWMLRGVDTLDGTAPWPAVGYLIATTGALHASADLELPAVDVVRGPTSADTLRAAVAALQTRSAERGRGELHAPGALRGERRDEVRDGALALAPPCNHCVYTALCGRGGPP